MKEFYIKIISSSSKSDKLLKLSLQNKIITNVKS